MTAKQGTQAQGQRGEDLAADFLKGQGYRICERNFRGRCGEIDIIAKKGRTLCFIEVKLRSTDAYGTGFEAVVPGKQRKLSRAALEYLTARGLMPQESRFDVIEIFPSLAGESQRINHLADAFAFRGSAP